MGKFQLGEIVPGESVNSELHEQQDNSCKRTDISRKEQLKHYIIAL